MMTKKQAKAAAQDAADDGALEHTPYCFTGSPCLCTDWVKAHRRTLGWYRPGDPDRDATPLGWDPPDDDDDD